MLRWSPSYQSSKDPCFHSQILALCKFSQFDRSLKFEFQCAKFEYFELKESSTFAESKVCSKVKMILRQVCLLFKLSFKRNFGSRFSESNFQKDSKLFLLELNLIVNFVKWHYSVCLKLLDDCHFVRPHYL